MPLQLVAYAYVEPGGEKPRASIHAVSGAIAKYLEGHVGSLLERARKGSAARAVFSDQAGHALFESLRTGTKSHFLSLTQELAERLQGEMDNRSKRGFLVTLRRSLPESRSESAALKLDIHDEVAAAARRSNDGQLTLEAVVDLLDMQGDLQKGAVFPDFRNGSQVVVGDRVGVDTALYFLRTLQVRQFAKESSANQTFMSVVAEVTPAKARKVAQTVNREAAATSPEDFFEAHPDLVSEEERTEVLRRLTEKRRPVNRISPTKPVREVISADGIEIRGRAEDIDEKVEIRESITGWEIVVTVRSEPRRYYT